MGLSLTITVIMQICFIPICTKMFILLIVLDHSAVLNNKIKRLIKINFSRSDQTNLLGEPLINMNSLSGTAISNSNIEGKGVPIYRRLQTLISAHFIHTYVGDRY